MPTLDDLVNAELSKPYKERIEVTRLVTCPFLEIPESYATRLGQQKHEYIENMLTAKGFRVEVTIAVNVDGLLIVGRVDALDENNLTVYEIKPFSIKDSYIRQLSLYVAILRRLTGQYWDGKFLVYNKDKLLELTPSFLDMTILDTVLKMERTTIKGEYCSLCTKDKKCEKKKEWRRPFNFDVSEIKTLDWYS